MKKTRLASYYVFGNVGEQYFEKRIWARSAQNAVDVLRDSLSAKHDGQIKVECVYKEVKDWE